MVTVSVLLVFALPCFYSSFIEYNRKRSHQVKIVCVIFFCDLIGAVEKVV